MFVAVCLARASRLGSGPPSWHQATARPPVPKPTRGPVVGLPVGFGPPIPNDWGLSDHNSHQKEWLYDRASSPIWGIIRLPCSPSYDRAPGPIRAILGLSYDECLLFFLSLLLLLLLGRPIADITISGQRRSRERPQYIQLCYPCLGLSGLSVWSGLPGLVRLVWCGLSGLVCVVCLVCSVTFVMGVLELRGTIWPSG